MDTVRTDADADADAAMAAYQDAGHKHVGFREYFGNVQVADFSGTSPVALSQSTTKAGAWRLFLSRQAVSKF